MNAQADTRIDTLAETLVIHAIMTIINISTEEETRDVTDQQLQKAKSAIKATAKEVSEKLLAETEEGRWVAPEPFADAVLDLAWIAKGVMLEQ